MRDEPIWDKPWYFYVAVALPCLGGLTLALLFSSLPMCRLEGPERVSVAVETCYQNVGVATAVAISMFDGEDQAKAVGVPLYYGFVEALLLAIFCVYAWKAGWTLAPASAEDVLRPKKEEEIRAVAVAAGGESGSSSFGDGDGDGGGSGGGLEGRDREEEAADISNNNSGGSSRGRRCSLSRPCKELQAFWFILSNDYQQEERHRRRPPGRDDHPSHYDDQQRTRAAAGTFADGHCDTPHASSSQQHQEATKVSSSTGAQGQSVAKTPSERDNDFGVGGGGASSVIVADQDFEGGGGNWRETRTAKEATISGGST